MPAMLYQRSIPIPPGSTLGLGPMLARPHFLEKTYTPYFPYLTI